MIKSSLWSQYEVQYQNDMKRISKNRILSSGCDMLSNINVSYIIGSLEDEMIDSVLKLWSLIGDLILSETRKRS